MPGMVRIGELISSIMDLISFSISSISVSNSRMSLMVCLNSRAFAGIFEPMEFLADSYFDEVNEEPVIYHWKYKLEEIDPNEKVVVDTLPVKKSS